MKGGSGVNKIWLNTHFRVWVVRIGEVIPEYLENVWCISLDQTGPVLSGRFPEAAWLWGSEFNRIELLSAECGDPMEYDPLNVRFKCHAPIAADYSIEPLAAMMPEDRAAIDIYVHFHCSDVEWVYVR